MAHKNHKSAPLLIAVSVNMVGVVFYYLKDTPIYLVGVIPAHALACIALWHFAVGTTLRKCFVLSAFLICDTAAIAVGESLVIAVRLGWKMAIPPLSLNEGWIIVAASTTLCAGLGILWDAVWARGKDISAAGR